MKTWTTTAVVQDGKLVLEVPHDFDTKVVQVQLLAAENAWPANNGNLTKEEKLAALQRVAGFYKGPSIDTELLRRENLYGDDGR